ncbi:hypothetical protein L3X38_017412 [Prunus dulcis]|uniref:Uncharacterized protein n=1 Tax=Prunus dulcis TaxID=3755 RepID=A0AAD4W7S0_PRUDU|nr:hypothetical protein L3X38_017412 [Prunus dulcis]
MLPKPTAQHPSTQLPKLLPPCSPELLPTNCRKLPPITLAERQGPSKSNRVLFLYLTPAAEANTRSRRLALAEAKLHRPARPATLPKVLSPVLPPKLSRQELQLPCRSSATCRPLANHPRPAESVLHFHTSSDNTYRSAQPYSPAASWPNQSHPAAEPQQPISSQ